MIRPRRAFRLPWVGPWVALWVLLGLSLPVGFGSGVALAAPPETIDPDYQAVRDLMSEKRKERAAARDRLIARNDPGLLFGIVDALFFIGKPFRGEAIATLEALAGEKAGASYWEWVELAGRRENLVPTPGYASWKSVLFSHVDPRYQQILAPGHPRRIRLEEIVSGGVKVEGIPTLDDPPMVPASDPAANYLRDQESVFAAAWGGEQRAWPLRFLDWHEMLNDQLGGRPVSLSYCTLCGAGVLYHTTRPGGGSFRFATSGLLYRSNKLMFDRETQTLWNNLTGEPVLGPLADPGAGPRPQLEVLPLVRTTWGDWRRRHPQTLVVALTPELRQRFASFGFDYQPGKADRARRGVRFPVWKKSPSLPEKAEVFGIRGATGAKVWSLDALFALATGKTPALLADGLGELPLWLIADPTSGAVRAYQRDPAQALTWAPGHDDRLVDPTGKIWRITEEGLVTDDGQKHARVAGNLAFWFGWYAFYPQTEVWQGSEGTSP